MIRASELISAMPNGLVPANRENDLPQKRKGL
jgi:hypothetical protein